ncbi:MAG TPA: hypothetical protein VHQ22_02740 [Terriglobales bacterium]|nr:hypothetical protein [Terriglobales bacterium]
MRHLRMISFAIVVLAVCAASMSAQGPGSAPVVTGDIAMGPAPLGPKAGVVTMHVEDMDAEPVKGAPFCGTITTEHTQTFSDGNRIHTTENSTLCRDGAGRTRREASLNLLGAATQSSAAKLITIMDPIAGFRYMLDSESKIAHKMPIPSSLSTRTGIGNEAGTVAVRRSEGVMLYQRVGTAGPNMVMNNDVFFKKAGRQDGPAPATENLGDETIDGIHATGTRITTTIPAGEMGNEQPIAVVSERWYSPELKVTIMTKHTDPWAGELKTQLTNVNTSEPDPSLFLVPSDYKVVSDKVGQFFIQKRLMTPAPPE